MALNSALDSWQTGCIYTAEFVPNFPNQSGTQNGACVAAPGWRGCADYSASPEKCNATQIGAYNRYIEDFDAIISHKGTYTKPGNGAFIHSCHTHCEAQDSHLYTTFAVGGVTMQQAVSKWWAADDDTPAHEHTYVPCTYI